MGRQPAPQDAVSTLLALKSILRTRPPCQRIWTILDNLPAHKNKDIRAWASANRVTLLFAPTYASWADPIGAQFGPLRQFTMAHYPRAHHTEQTRDLHACLAWRNSNSRHPHVLAAAPSSWPAPVVIHETSGRLGAKLSQAGRVSGVEFRVR